MRIQKIKCKYSALIMIIISFIIILCTLAIVIRIPIVSYNGISICGASRDQMNPNIISSGDAIIVWQDKRNDNWDIYAQKINRNGRSRWQRNGIQVCTANEDQEIPQIISDNCGGAIIVWQDKRNDNRDIYAQKINRNGRPQWQWNGIQVCTANGNQEFPQIISDNCGGAIIVWSDWRGDRDIYAQRIDREGNILWRPDGVAVCDQINGQVIPMIVPGDDHSAIVVWNDSRHGNHDIYAQKIDADGNVCWGPDGEPICIQDGSQLYMNLISDGNGGAIIVWWDEREGIIDPNIDPADIWWNINADIYAQRIDGEGIAQWPLDGIPVCTERNGQEFPEIVPSDNGGAIIVWEDYRNGIADNANYDIFAQKIDANGIMQYQDNGVAICTAEGYQDRPFILSNENGGAIIAWADFRIGNNKNVYAQRLNLDGIPQWPQNGAPICTANRSQGNSGRDGLRMLSDGNGGAFITWTDWRNSHADIYAQRLNRNGSRLWRTIRYYIIRR